MSETTLMYGGKSLTLTKSPDLVGVKAERGRILATHTIATRLGAIPTGDNMAGFEIVDVGNLSLSMEEALDSLRSRSEVQVGTHIYYTSDDGVPFIPTGSVYIRFMESASLKRCETLLKEHALAISEVRGERELITHVTANSVNPIKVAVALQNSSLVDVAEPDFAVPIAFSALPLPTDQLLSFQWHLRNTGIIDGSSLFLKAGADARVVDAWEIAQSLGARDISVAVIDDGFDLSHRDLSGVGKIVAPWDFLRNSSDPRPEYQYGDWHGTACAGLAVGNANGYGILGSAPGCKLMPVRTWRFITDGSIEAMFAHVRQEGAAVVSCSWGAGARNAPLSERAQKAIADCATLGRNGLGTVICFAAGNENRDINDETIESVNGFAIHPDVIAVSASTSMDERSDYSNFGKEIAVCAPSSGAGGVGIVTSDVTGTFSVGGDLIGAGYSNIDFTGSFGGTSAATPIVAGVCALLLSVNPTLKATEVKSILQNTARKIGPAGSYDATGHSLQFGYGCVNAAAAISSLLVVPTAVEGERHKSSNARSNGTRKQTRSG